MFIASLVGDIIRVSICWKVYIYIYCLCTTTTTTTTFTMQCNILVSFITFRVPYICSQLLGQYFLLIQNSESFSQFVRAFFHWIFRQFFTCKKCI
jgi:hypothetical protein